MDKCSKKRSKEYQERKKVQRLDNIESGHSKVDSEHSDIENKNSNVTVESKVTEMASTLQFNEVEEIKQWVVSCKIAHVHVDKLLKILKRRLLPNIPLSTTTLLQKNVKSDKETAPEMLDSLVSPNIADDPDIADAVIDSMESCTSQMIEPLQERSSAIKEELEESHSNPSCSMEHYQDMDSGTIKTNTVDEINIPLINISNVVCSTPFETAVVAELCLIENYLQQLNVSMNQVTTSVNQTDNCIKVIDNQISVLENSIKQLHGQQNEACNFLLNKEIINNTSIDFEKKYKLKLPIDDLESFLKFDGQLKTNDFLKKDVCTELMNHIDKDYCIAKSYVHMLKLFITKNVATKFTASRMSADKENPKEKFKPTEFYKCMEALMFTCRQRKMLETTEKDLTSNLSDVLSNAKKWKENKSTD